MGERYLLHVGVSSAFYSAISARFSYSITAVAITASGRCILVLPKCMPTIGKRQMHHGDGTPLTKCTEEHTAFCAGGQHRPSGT